MGKTRSVRIGYAAVDGGRNYRTEARHSRETLHGALVATVAALTRSKLDLLVFPAGYFQVREPSEQARVAAKVAADLDALSPAFGIAFGIDCQAGTKTAKTAKKRAAKTAHPFFVYYRSPSGTLTRMQQVSVTASEGTAEVVDRRWNDRSLLLPGTPIALLICGESWSDVLLDRVARSGCRALVVAAHRNVNLHREPTGYGKLSWHRRLTAFHRQHGIPVVLSEHTRSPARHPYSWPPGISTALPDEVPAAVSARIAVI